MREERSEPTMRFVVVVTVLFWASAALITVAAPLSLVALGLREVWSFNLLGGTCAALAMVSSAFLFWQELSADRQQMCANRREKRHIPRQGRRHI